MWKLLLFPALFAVLMLGACSSTPPRTERRLMPTYTPTPATPATTLPLLGVTLTTRAVNGLTVHTHPEIAAPPVARLEDGTTVDVIGRFSDGNWYKVRLPDRTEGWVPSEFVVLNGDPAALPVTRLENYPLPTPVPTGKPVRITSVETRVMDQTGPLWDHAWRVSIRNDGDQEANVMATLLFLDADGFQVDEAYIDGVIAPHVEQEFIGSESIPEEQSPKVVTATARIDYVRVPGTMDVIQRGD